MKEIVEWARSMSPIITVLGAIFIALSGWAYHHYEFDNPKKPHWLSNESNFAIIIMVIIAIVLIAYSIYNNFTSQLTIPVLTTTQTTTLIQTTESSTTTHISTTTSTSTIPPSFTLTGTGYSLTGIGNYNSPSFQLNNSTVFFYIAYEGNSTFTVKLLDQNNNETLLENCVVDGTYFRSSSMLVQEGIQYTLQIIASGNWTINIIK